MVNMAFRYSKVGVIVAILVLLPATLILSVTSPFGATGVLLTLILWILIPVVIAKMYYRFKKVE
jgi:hypothetical protein